MNRTNYNRQLTKIEITLTCLSCDTTFTRKVPRLPGKNPTRGICYACKRKNKKIAFDIEGETRHISPKSTGGNA